jgi:hypothetical protein
VVSKNYHYAIAAIISATLIPTPSLSENIYTAPSPNISDTDRLNEMAALYDDLCLKTFPDDDAFSETMKQRNATPMTEQEVKDYLRDDYGVGWNLAGKTGTFRISIEAPAFHACVIRTTTIGGLSNLARYKEIFEREESAWVGRQDIPPQSYVREGTETVAEGQARRREDGKIETLMVGTTKVIDPILSTNLKGIEVRFVHQIVTPARGT